MRVNKNSVKSYIGILRENYFVSTIHRYRIVEDITVPEAPKGISQDALNRVGVVRENVARNR